MGKIIASYLAKVIVREDDDLPPDVPEDQRTPPTIAALEGTIADALNERAPYLTATVTAERTDA